MPPAKRGRDAAAAAADETEKKHQRHMSAVDDAFAELVCPISQSLPVDPVMADDNQVYERAAITEWLQKGNKKSPMTCLPMGDRLRPATQVKNMIRKMVESGTIAGAKADAWKKKLAEVAELRRKVAEWRREAEEGSGAAMCNLGHWYCLTKDHAKAFEWLTKSYEAGFAGGAGMLGRCYAHGWGVEKCVFTASMYITTGAENGSKAACCELGNIYAMGEYGVTKNLKVAREWYSKVATASIRDITDEGLKNVAAWLREHPA